MHLFAVLFGGATATPAYTRDVLLARPDVFGHLRAAPGIGGGATPFGWRFGGSRAMSGYDVRGLCSIRLGNSSVGAGATAAWFSLVPAIVVGAVATIVATVLWARPFFPALWRMHPALWRMQTFEH